MPTFVLEFDSWVPRLLYRIQPWHWVHPVIWVISITFASDTTNSTFPYHELPFWIAMFIVFILVCCIGRSVLCPWLLSHTNVFIIIKPIQLLSRPVTKTKCCHAKNGQQWEGFWVHFEKFNKRALCRCYSSHGFRSLKRKDINEIMW